MSQTYAVIAFSTTYDALAFKATCLKQGVEGRLISIPREISAGCGYAWKTPVRNRAAIERFIRENNLGFESIHELDLP